MESSRTHFEVLGLGLEASRPWKLACPRLEDSLLFELLKFCGALEKFFGKRFFEEIAWKIFVKTFFFWRSPEKFMWRPFFFFLENTCACVLGPWPRAFLSLASRVSVLGKAVLGLGFFLCPWPWPRASCPRLHLRQLLHWVVLLRSNQVDFISRIDLSW